MMAEKVRNVFLKIVGFVIGMLATIVAVFLFGAAALLIIIIVGCITLVIRRTHKRHTNEIEYLKKEVNKLKEKNNGHCNRLWNMTHAVTFQVPTGQHGCVHSVTP